MKGSTSRHRNRFAEHRKTAPCPPPHRHSGQNSGVGPNSMSASIFLQGGSRDARWHIQRTGILADQALHAVMKAEMLDGRFRWGQDAVQGQAFKQGEESPHECVPVIAHSTTRNSFLNAPTRTSKSASFIPLRSKESTSSRMSSILMAADSKAPIQILLSTDGNGSNRFSRASSILDSAPDNAVWASCATPSLGTDSIKQHPANHNQRGNFTPFT